MAGYANLTLRDESNETSTVSFTLGNITAVSIAGTLAAWGPFRDALAALSLGEVAKEQMTVFNTVLSNDLPSDPYAQRELKWLVQYEDSQAFFDAPVNAIPNEGYLRRHTFAIPIANLYADRKVPNEDKANFDSDFWIDFKAAAEGLLRSPSGGTITILSAELVGRDT